MDHRHKSYLRPLRRQVGFTHKELAFLIGVKSRTVISRIETSVQQPSLEAMLIYSIVFDTCTTKLCPNLTSQIYEAIVQRANDLYVELQGNPCKAVRAKL